MTDSLNPVVETKPTKPSLTNDIYPNFPKQIYQIKYTKTNLPDQTYQNKHTKPNILNQLTKSTCITVGVIASFLHFLLYRLHYYLFQGVRVVIILFQEVKDGQT